MTNIMDIRYLGDSGCYNCDVYSLTTHLSTRASGSFIVCLHFQESPAIRTFNYSLSG